MDGTRIKAVNHRGRNFTRARLKTDLGLLAQTATAAQENLAVNEIDVVADRGYYKIEDIEDCEAAGITPYVPKPDRSTARHSGHYMKSEFKYDATIDAYGCPAGQRLAPFYRHCVSKTREGTWLISWDRVPGIEATRLESCSESIFLRRSPVRRIR